MLPLRDNFSQIDLSWFFGQCDFEFVLDTGHSRDCGDALNEFASDLAIGNCSR